MSDIEFTAYCGLYCIDCIPSDSSLFSIAKELQERLHRCKFEEYAKVKAYSNKLFDHYPEFGILLQEIINLQCNAPCRKDGGKVVCPIRDCAQSRNYRGCWECSDRLDCELLAPLRNIHPHIDYHLDLIAQVGEKNWSTRRKKHYSWE